ncbi:hypothetical protein QO001_006434 [Methylobacterium brachiatum]|jgi:hypothetical protein|uniref:Beta/Gamma crystallin n=1 Tax=Methylobacterium brachiatum TaxID=269660 RepID=A0AAJ1TV51_9HYPH|nr:hypothetical protein [Methylobacterium brachiatum]MCB4806452.1 hypothetical protein [Methylobacterium brachiatum]MDQ0547475.1 hypothetical protein [Methylobacterium brachiatum]
MTRSPFLMLLVLALASAGPAPVNAAEPFRRLPGRDLTARLPGMELTEDVHWTYGFERGGRQRSVSMGTIRTGAWRVRGDELCLDGGPDGARCFQVWAAGNAVDLRRDDGTLPDAGILHKPQSRR